ncbi:acetyl-CoA hydrolase [Caloramator sp. E03]|uniref:acetyl-CoA hydrolase n=1 Tax=Caloramator sp. E03 TaxID=2576307 RepID=UPI00111047E7|nr:acetyl-CoA hydrolase [Caloramator sp. E03]QCX34419.1 acetyl-CoA hydrolase [Caloramator sp. E03]
MQVNLMRSIILNCVREENDLPAAYRWLYKYHVADSISQFAPYVSKYATYRALPVPPDGEDFGTYNWIMTEHYWLINPFENIASNMPRGLAFSEYYTPEFLEITNQPPQAELRSREWVGSRNGYHPIVFSFIPLFWENDFKGSQRTIEDGPNYRWLIVFKYPECITREEGDDWFINVLAPQIAELKEVNRFVSSAVLKEPQTSPFHRVAEIWFDDSKAWHRAIVENKHKFTKPGWAQYGQFPFMEPYKDFVGIFLLDRPESDHLQQFRGYITTR